jgi:acetylornithine aminotransferase
MTLAKALGNGVPVGACVARGEAAQTFQPGNHGTTFGGNPLACRAAYAVLNTIEQEGLVERASVLGRKILDGLKAQLEGQTNVADIRGKGLLIAVELTSPCKVLAQQALDAGIVINIANENRIRLLPPLILSDSEADIIINKVSELVKNFKPD